MEVLFLQAYQSRWVVSLSLVLVLALALGAGAQTRMGTWLDEVVFVQEADQSQAVTRLEVGDIDVYADTLTNAELFQRVLNSPFLTYSESFGSYSELTFNPYGPEFEDGRLNPFSVPRVREAMNYLIDRDFIADELYGGLGQAKYFATNAAFPDYARYAAAAKALELKYAYDKDTAAEIIAEEMDNLGAELVDGTWHYNGEPVDIIVLIRDEDERRLIGDYVASQLEDIGFTATRLYRAAAEASPLWIGADPALGQMHIYTGGWISTAVSRDTSFNFTQFYMPQGQASPLWEAYTPTEEFVEIARRLEHNIFSNMEEREEVFTRAWELGLEDSVRIWLIDQLAFTPRRAGTLVAADMAGAIAGSWLWSSTLRREGEVGGSMTIGLQSLLTEPWNPIDGTNWIYDAMLQRGAAENATVIDPYTGLAYPRRLERAELFVSEGLPVGQTLDWVDLNFVEGEIEVPGDAWVDWDPVEQRFITADEKFPEGLTALRKSVVHYPADLFDTVKWHDGSPISVADFVLPMILGHERAMEESAIYDQSSVPGYDSGMSVFKGRRIVSTDPLIIESYGDDYALDAENSIVTFWPQFTYGPGSWHALAITLLAEGNQETAYSAAKASLLDIEWLNMIAGPSLEVLARHLSDAADTGYIPYASVLGEFLDADEVAQRYANLSSWYADKGHFWLGTGPLYLDSVFPVESTAVLKRNEAYPDAADRWDIFAEPMVAEVEVEGPARLSPGQDADFDVWVTFDGEAYPQDLIADVTFLVISAAGEVALTGDAEFVADGLYEIRLTADDIAGLPVGAGQLAAIVVPIPVAKPTMETVSFVVTP